MPLSAKVLASYFEERIKETTTESGSTGYLQTPKSAAEGFVQSADSLPDDIDVNNISAASSQLYRFSIWPFEFIVNYDSVNGGVGLALSIQTPIIGRMQMPTISGNLNTGISLKVSFKAIGSGVAGVKLNGKTAVLYWDLSAFGKNYKDSVNLFNI